MLKENEKVNVSLAFGALSSCLHLSDVPNLELKEISRLRKVKNQNFSFDWFENAIFG